MKVLNIFETPLGITIRHRPLPALLMAIFMTAFIGFGAWCLQGVWSDIQEGRGSWLPPFDRLSSSTKLCIIYGCIGISLLICLIPWLRSMRILLLGENWNIDTQLHVVRRNGKFVTNVTDLAKTYVEVDSRGGEGTTLTFYFIARDGRRIKVSETSQYSQLHDFMELADLIKKRTKLPFEQTELK